MQVKSFPTFKIEMLNLVRMKYFDRIIHRKEYYSNEKFVSLIFPNDSVDF